MLSLQRLTDSKLTDGLKRLVGQERKILIQVIEHLEEVERRKLCAKRGYSSLFEYCTKELGYSAAAAQRRIASMRLSRQVPEIKSEIKSGALNLSSIAMADSFFRAEAKSGNSYALEKKSELLKELTGKTTKQVEQKLVSLSPKFVQTKEKERMVTPDLTEIKVTFNNKQLQKLKRLKELGVSSGKLTNAELLEWAMDIAIDKVDPIKKAERAQKRNELKDVQTRTFKSKNRSATSIAKQKAEENLQKQSSAYSPQKSRKALPNRNLKAKTKLTTPIPMRKLDAAFREMKSNLSPHRAQSRSIPSQTRHKVFLRDGGKCTYIDPITGKKCECRTNLEIDHIHPFALGGDNSVENLRLLCRTHNQLRAEQTFGQRASGQGISERWHNSLSD